MTSHLNKKKTEEILKKLAFPNKAFSARYPGEPSERQPIHSVYGGAHLFQFDTPKKLGDVALRTMEEYAVDFGVFARALGLQGSEKLPLASEAIVQLRETITKDLEKSKTERPESWLALMVYDRVIAKLKREPVEDFRIDFEDGFGNRSEEEEDEAAEKTAKEVAKGMKEGTLSPFIGIRVKTFTNELAPRSIRTADIFVSTLLSATKGKLPEHFVITLPKVTIPEQVEGFIQILEMLEEENDLKKGSLKMEVMIETTQSVIDHEGKCVIPSLIQASQGRCIGAHLGVYDYTASCNIIAAHQGMDHPSCDFVRQMMKNSLAGTGIFLSDGATNIMPVPVHPPKGKLHTKQIQENFRAVHYAWKLAYQQTRNSLKNAIYQGWDLHPAQLPIRYAACYSFFLEVLLASTERLKNFVDQAAKATLAGNVFDDAATAQGLLNYFLQGMKCGAITEEEMLATGLTLKEIEYRSFAKIIEKRLKKKEK